MTGLSFAYGNQSKAAQMLVYRAVRLLTQKTYFLKKPQWAAFAADMEVTTKVAQLHGGYAYTEYEIERSMRRLQKLRRYSEAQRITSVHCLNKVAIREWRDVKKIVACIKQVPDTKVCCFQTRLQHLIRELLIIMNP